MKNEPGKDPVTRRESPVRTRLPLRAVVGQRIILTSLHPHRASLVYINVCLLLFQPLEPHLALANPVLGLASNDVVDNMDEGYHANQCHSGTLVWEPPFTVNRPKCLQAGRHVLRIQKKKSEVFLPTKTTILIRVFVCISS